MALPQWIYVSYIKNADLRHDLVDSLFKRITADTRHHRIFLLSQTLVSRRDLPEWTMGLKSLAPKEIEQFPELEACFSQGPQLQFANVNEGAALNLLRGFVETLR